MLPCLLFSASFFVFVFGFVFVCCCLGGGGLTSSCLFSEGVSAGLVICVYPSAATASVLSSRSPSVIVQEFGG